MAKCDCLVKVNKLLQEQYDDSEARVVLNLCVLDGKLDVYPGISAECRQKKKDGTFGKKKTISIRPSFCPFCGKKYE